MNKEIARAHYDSMIEWANLYAHNPVEGSQEVAFSMRRTARQIAKVAELQLTNLQPEPKEPEPSVEDLRDG